MTLNNIIWIGSFPKSGNTWVRAFLGNYFQPTGKALTINGLSSITTSDVRADWFAQAAGRLFQGETVDDWLRLRPRVLNLISTSTPNSIFVKTHSKIGIVNGIELIPPQVTAAAICIVRNPFDLVVSFARHSNISIDTAIERYTDDMNMGRSNDGIYEFLGRWDSHVSSWVNAPGLPRHVMRYEDMVDDPNKEYHNSLKFLQIPIDKKTLRKAIQASSFDTLKSQEKKSGFIERPSEMKTFFVTGNYGGWEKTLSQEQIGKIVQEFEPTLKIFYPDILDKALNISIS